MGKQQQKLIHQIIEQCTDELLNGELSSIIRECANMNIHKEGDKKNNDYSDTEIKILDMTANDIRNITTNTNRKKCHLMDSQKVAIMQIIVKQAKNGESGVKFFIDEHNRKFVDEYIKFLNSKGFGYSLSENAFEITW